jgi:hypothetical protein
MSTSAISGSPYEIHTGATIHRAYETVFQNLQLVVEMAWLPFVLILAAEVVGLVLGGGGYGGQMLSWLLGGLATLFFGTTFAVRWLRHVLLGETASAELFPAAWRPLFFATITIALLVFAGGVVVSLIGLILSPLAILIWIVGSIAVSLVALRILLMLPAAALERPIEVRTAWDMMQGNYWHLFACALICYVPFALISGFISGVDDVVPWVVWVVMEAIRIAVTFLGLACLYAMLADVYHGMTGEGRSAITSAAD